MRKVVSLLASAALAGGLTLALSAAPAHATQLRNVYYGYDDCVRYGSYGVEHGMWPYYTCTWVSNGSSVPPTGFWFLYA
ncbi:hypothetical protein JOL79_05070 [Microbispora sp. RL4-1S]|uniref:Secreted protein n=1 Tax=Microbispora oryzae TaxID=2806554 RepID=A0A940WFJ9_9ACTN|nr:hypothetical protein [Microbispora oryzae]MBP2703172.1 hypothetical protein [Microbispora oryzae]